MKGILVVPPRELRGGSPSRMGQDKIDAETLALIERASVDQLVAIGRAVDAARVLVEPSSGRLLSKVMVPIMKGIGAILEFYSYLGEQASAWIVGVREQAGVITQKSVELQTHLTEAKKVPLLIAEAIAKKDPSIGAIYYRNDKGKEDVLVVAPHDPNKPQGRKVASLIVGQDFAEIRKAVDAGKEAVIALGYGNRIGFVETVIAIIAAIVALIIALTLFVSKWNEGKVSAQERVLFRLATVNDEIKSTIEKIADLEVRIREIEESSKGREMTAIERDTVNRLRAELKKLEGKKDLLLKERDFILGVGGGIRDADDAFSSLKNLAIAIGNVLLYTIGGVAAISVLGTVIYFLTR
jgi:hypothetical protein